MNIKSIYNMKRRIILVTIYVLMFYRVSFAGEILSWDDCVRESSRNHSDLISAEEDINQSKAGKAIVSSVLYPQASADLSAQTSKATVSSGAGSGSETRHAYSYGVSGTQLIFDGLKTRQDIKSSVENIKAAQQAYKFSSSGIRLRLRTAFVNLLRAQELLFVAQDIFDLRRGSLELITLRYESGLEHRGALLTAEANLALAQFELNQSKRDLEVAQRQLNKEMGRKTFLPMGVKSGFEIRTEKEKPDLELIAKSNPQLRQVVFQKNAALFGIKSAYAEYFPEISAQVSADRTGSHWPARDKELSAALSLSLPIFEGGLRNAQIAQAKSVFRQFEANERSTKDAIVLNLEQAWQALDSAIETAEVQKKVLAATEERAKIAEAQYSTGFLNFDNWTIIQDNLVNAKKNYLERRVDMLLAEANWVQAKGETLEYVE